MGSGWLCHWPRQWQSAGLLYFPGQLTGRARCMGHVRNLPTGLALVEEAHPHVPATGTGPTALGKSLVGSSCPP